MLRTFVLSEETHAQALWTFLKQNWGAMAQAGKPLAVIVHEHKDKRTDAQNRMLHALLTEIAENAWVNGRKFSLEEWKEHYKRTFIGVEEILLPDNTRIERGISTTTLDVEEFSKLIMKIEEHAINELGIELT
jgi:hypothetical protein